MKQSIREGFGGWQDHHRKMVAVMALLLMAVAYWHGHPWSVPWSGPRMAQPPSSGAPAIGLPGYEASIQRQAIAGIEDNLSGLTFSNQTDTLFSVINRPPSVAELSTDGQLLRMMPLHGVKDPEGIAHIHDDWFAIADERMNRVYWVEIPPDQQTVSVQQDRSMDLGESNIRNFAVEGLGWDSKRQQLLAVLEKWPMRVLAIQAPGMTSGTAVAPPRVYEWTSQDAAGVPSSDLASIEVDPRTGNWLLLSEEASAIYEYTPEGEMLDVMPLWSGKHGLTQYIPQPEGMAMDPEGTLYVVSEPNLFYRFEKRP